jgi:tetratricopeptide (TPR) repeat protein
MTQEEANTIDDEFLDAIPENYDYSENTARKVLAAWNHLVQIMARENNMSDHLGISSIDWQIGNWANDTVEFLHNARMYEDEIKVNEQILRIKWSGTDNLFHENAKRDIADAYADMGNPEKCLKLYEEYLKEDPLWGWGWIGYFRQLKDYANDRFEPTLDMLYQKTLDGVNFRDKDYLYEELGDEFNNLGITDRANYFYELAKKKSNNNSLSFKTLKTPAVKPQKIYPNDPCPCGSGKKYKKCCGRGSL